MLATPGPSVPMHRPGFPVIRDAASAKRVAQTADAVVIGSRIIQEIEAGAADQAVSRVKAFLKPIREALGA